MGNCWLDAQRCQLGKLLVAEVAAQVGVPAGVVHHDRLVGLVIARHAAEWPDVIERHARHRVAFIVNDTRSQQRGSHFSFGGGHEIQVDHAVSACSCALVRREG